MKIISLNAYFGTCFDPLMEFIEHEAANTDIFCLQEMVSAEQNLKQVDDKGKRLNVLQEIVQRLPDHQLFFAPMQSDFETNPTIYGHSEIGVAIFVKNNLLITKNDYFFLCNNYNSFVPGDYSTIGFPTQWVQFNFDGQPLTICSVHGNSEPGHKLDTPERLLQSQKIIDFLKTQPGQKIVMGDFNLLPNTESVQMFKPAGFRNLIEEYKISSTRGTNNRKLHPEFGVGKYGFQEFADYTFVSPEIKVTEFTVPEVPVSDHLPMILKIEI